MWRRVGRTKMDTFIWRGAYRHRWARHIVVLLLLVGIARPASANIVYGVNLSLGASGTATGDIVTDGTTGTIGAANILDWNLTLNDGVNGALTLLGPSSGNNSFVALNGSAVSATASALLFNFSSPSAADAYLYFETNGLPVSFLCFGGGGAGGYSGNCAGGQPGNVEAVEDQGNSIQSTLLSGTQAIATTPLPTTLPLFVGALGAMGLLGWRQKRKTSALAV